MKKSDYNFKCYTYGKRGKGERTPHHIREEELYAIILDDLRRVTHFARKKERQFAEYINRKNTARLRQEINALQMELDTMDYLSQYFDGYYMKRELNRDFAAIETLSTWCRGHGKKLHMLEILEPAHSIYPYVIENGEPLRLVKIQEGLSC